jgi:hypothetical protein
MYAIATLDTANTVQNIDDHSSCATSLCSTSGTGETRAAAAKTAYAVITSLLCASIDRISNFNSEANASTKSFQVENLGGAVVSAERSDKCWPW